MLYFRAKPHLHNKKKESEHSFLPSWWIHTSSAMYVSWIFLSFTSFVFSFQSLHVVHHSPHSPITTTTKGLYLLFAIHRTSSGLSAHYQHHAIVVANTTPSYSMSASTALSLPCCLLPVVLVSATRCLGAAQHPTATTRYTVPKRILQNPPSALTQPQSLFVSTTLDCSSPYLPLSALHTLTASDCLRLTYRLPAHCAFNINHL